MKNTQRITIALTGGGTAGHVMPNIALIPDLEAHGYHVIYIGSSGIEKELLKSYDLAYYTIQVGKLRRYFSWQNFFDIFKVALGFFQSFFILLRTKPQLIFSKGGFVSVPVALAARVLNIKIFTHESDVSPGLANKIILKFANKIFYSFSETEQFLPKNKAIFSGTPIRKNLFQGSKEKALKFCHFKDDDLSTVLVMGGSLGALKINTALHKALPKILEKFKVIHITGRGKEINFKHPNYCCFPYVYQELKAIFAITEFIIARAGANSIFEFLALKKPMLLIPLEAGSRGDQVLNSESFRNQGWARVLREGQLDDLSLLSELEILREQTETIVQHQSSWSIKNPNDIIIQTIKTELK